MCECLCICLCKRNSSGAANWLMLLIIAIKWNTFIRVEDFKKYLLTILSHVIFTYGFWIKTQKKKTNALIFAAASLLVILLNKFLKNVKA